MLTKQIDKYLKSKDNKRHVLALFNTKAKKRQLFASPNQLYIEKSKANMKTRWLPERDHLGNLAYRSIPWLLI